MIFPWRIPARLPLIPLVLQHALPAGVAGWHTQSPVVQVQSRVFLDSCACGWLWARERAWAKGECKGMLQKEKETEETNQIQAILALFECYRITGWHCWIPHSFKLKGCDKKIFSILTRRLSSNSRLHLVTLRCSKSWHTIQEVFQSQKRLHFQLLKYVYTETFCFRIELDNWNGMRQTDRAYGGKAHFTFVHSFHFPNFEQNYLD